MSRKLVASCSALTLAGVVAVGGASAEAARADAVAGTLALKAEVSVAYPFADCPSGMSRLFECFVRSGKAIVPGLGPVDESYAYVLENAPPGCTASPGSDAVRLVATTARITVAGKGEIYLSTGGTGCLSRAGTLRSSEPFTITGGSGLYAGASGGGTLASVSYGPPAFTGVDTWTGELFVPGLQFDVTAPIISGAVDTSVRIARRAKRARVTYAVTAQDDVGGVVSVTCTPRSGSLFVLGRTRVTCSATDASGNTGTATFSVKVTRRR
jgi:hypothetical protein